MYAGTSKLPSVLRLEETTLCTIHDSSLLARLGPPPLVAHLDLLALPLLLGLRGGPALALAAACAALGASHGDVDIQLAAALGLRVGARALAPLVALAHARAQLRLEQRAVRRVEEGELGRLDLQR